MRSVRLFPLSTFLSRATHPPSLCRHSHRDEGASQVQYVASSSPIRASIPFPLADKFLKAGTVMKKCVVLVPIFNWQS